MGTKDTPKKIQAVIMDGGAGRRMISEGFESPKALLDIGGISVLAWQLRQLAAQDITRVLITVGSHRGARKIREYFGDGSGMRTGGGKPLGISISYYEEHFPLGNCGALLRIEDSLEDHFFLIGGDNVFAVDLKAFMQQHLQMKSEATVLTHPGTQPADRSLIITGEGSLVGQYLAEEEKKPAVYRNRVDSGIMILSKNVVTQIRQQYPPQTDGVRRIELSRDILKPLCLEKRLHYIDTAEYVRSISTPKRFAAVRADVLAGHVLAQRLSRLQRAVLLDWDALVSGETPGEEGQGAALRPCAAEAVRMMHADGYRVFVIRTEDGAGKLPEEEEERLFSSAETLLGADGAYVDAIRSGADGGALLKQIQEDFNVDMAQSWAVSAGTGKIAREQTADAETVLIGPDAGPREAAGESGAKTFPTLSEFAKFLHGREEELREELEEYRTRKEEDAAQEAQAPQKRDEDEPVPAKQSIAEFVEWLTAPGKEKKSGEKPAEKE